MDSCQKRTLGISVKVSEAMSRITDNLMNLTYVDAVALLQQLCPGTRPWPRAPPPSILFQKDRMNHQQLPEFIKIILPAHQMLIASSQGMKMTDSFSSLFTWENKSFPLLQSPQFF